MKIAIYSTQVIPTNPDLGQYGGLERINGLLAKYLAEQKHEVHLFATKESYFSRDKNGKKPFENAFLYAVGKAGTDPDIAWKSFWADEKSRNALKESDIVCDVDWDWRVYSKYKELKHLCHVCHAPDIGWIKAPPIAKPNIMAVGFNQAKLLSKAIGLEVRAVQNGIDLEQFKYNPKPIAERERLLWLHRIFFPKGAHRAIQIANNLKMPLDLCGGSFGDIPQYTAQIKKMCEQSQYATFHGEISHEQKLQMYHDAKAVLCPIIEYGMTDHLGRPFEWQEPWGLVTQESGASGTPVIVTPNGGWTEGVIHSFNGFFANHDHEFEYFIKRIDEIEPKNCRLMAEQYDYRKMGRNYELLFEEIINGNDWG